MKLDIEEVRPMAAGGLAITLYEELLGYDVLLLLGYVLDGGM